MNGLIALQKEIEQIFLDILEQEIKDQEKTLKNEVSNIEKNFSFMNF